MTYLATTRNDATHVIITDEHHNEIIDIPVGLISEGAQEWEREVDSILASEGFTRTSSWNGFTASVERK